MTLDEATGIKNYKDAKTRESLTDEEIYGRYIEHMGGLDAVADYIPFPLETIREKLAEDVNLNNTTLRCWDEAAGYKTGVGWNCHWQASSCLFVGGGIWTLYAKHGITSASCADGVCILKEAARRLVARETA